MYAEEGLLQPRRHEAVLGDGDSGERTAPLPQPQGLAAAVAGRERERAAHVPGIDSAEAEGEPAAVAEPPPEARVQAGSTREAYRQAPLDAPHGGAAGALGPARPPRERPAQVWAVDRPALGVA